jgi:hypothetical protein
MASIIQQTDKIIYKNNPGNLERAGYAGETDEGYGDNNRFPIYDSPVMGVRALLYDLNVKKNRYDGDVRKILQQYAPENENPNLENYIKFVEESLDNKPVTSDNIADMAKAIITFENQEIPDLVSYYLDDPKIMDEALKLYRTDLPSDYTYEDAQKILLGV